ncbi:hypothetical protein EVAR_9167_1 [Eumeta japonica]|uniref:Uncharacterized protein n=1 Tax=Eumeta variegata TaxID=151549 RepID=A0A4C1TWF6_EUMVA|nr:hypothetical protein EVAR_9167_1 [Eumeta japonica]
MTPQRNTAGGGKVEFYRHRRATVAAKSVSKSADTKEKVGLRQSSNRVGSRLKQSELVVALGTAFTIKSAVAVAAIRGADFKILEHPPCSLDLSLVIFIYFQVFFLRRCPNAETLSRHESPDCGAKRGITHAQ